MLKLCHPELVSGSLPAGRQVIRFWVKPGMTMCKNMDFVLITIKKGAISLAILGLFLSFSTPAWAGSEFSSASKQENKLAQGSPGKILPGRIDEKAAFAIREENVTREIDCTKWPEKFWIWLFGAYLFLLVFNLSYGLKNKNKIQWFWELFFTLLALWTWKKLDACEMQRWFFYCVIESGLIIYGFYLYSFLTSKKKEY
jgi:hypothetical protein